MDKLIDNVNLKLLVCFAALAGLSTSVLAADETVSGEKMTQAVSTSPRVTIFGQFRILKNGREAKLGEGFFGNPAALRLYRAADQEEMTVKVGKNGYFSRELAPGDYYVMSVAFKHQGETVAPDTNYLIRVSGDYETSYVGTITLETETTGGYMGSKGEVKRFVVTNDCPSECDMLLAQLGLQGATTTTSLPEWQTHVAFTR